MQEIFKLRVNKIHSEPSPYRRSALVQADESASVYNVEEVDTHHIKFVEYLKEEGKYVGVKLLYNEGGGYDSVTYGSTVRLLEGESFDFTYDGIRIDDEGCPEDFTIRFHISLCAYNA